MAAKRLHTSFMLRLLALLLGLGLVFAVSLHIHLRSLLRTEVSDKAALVFANLSAVQDYVRQTLRPAMYDHLPQGEFLIEAMSTSFVTRKVMNDLNQARDRYAYRRVALEPRNPEYVADGLERRLIARFRENPTLETIQEFHSADGQEQFLVARPVVFQQSCLSCHGRPEEAPKELIARYGSARGFGRTLGEIGGLDMVTLPVARESQVIQQTIAAFVLAFGGGTAALLGLIYAFFDRAVAHSLGRLGDALRRHFPAEADRTIGCAGGVNGAGRAGGQIEETIAAVERFAGCLREAQSQLEGHAAELEARVGERTMELRREAEARSADVRMFVDVLDAFGRHDARRRLLSAAMQAVARRFGAARASFICLVSTQQHHSWPEGVQRPALPDDWRDHILSGAAMFEPSRALVPVQTPDTVRGILILAWEGSESSEGGRGVGAQARTVLSAVGRQLGIALENLDALDSLLRQKNILESVFEGIADPLFLMDDGRHVVVANASARALAHELGAAEPGGAGGKAPREVRLSDGRSFSVRTYPLDGYGTGNGGPGGRMVVYARENTDEKRMLATMQQHEKAAAVGLLAAGLAHEINNPLGVILCYARLVEQQVADPQARQDLEIIVRHTLQAQKVLGDLLNFARPKRAAFGPVRLGDLAQAMLRIFQAQAAGRGVTLECDVPEDTPAVMADASALEQILANLLINAIDAVADRASAAACGAGTDAVADRASAAACGAGTHAAPCGRVQVAGRHLPDSGEVLLTVADNGPGIAEEHLSRVFDPFFSTKDVGKGTGLGLAVVYGLVRDMGGRVEAANDGGAVFSIHLPVAGLRGEAHGPWPGREPNAGGAA